MAVSDGPGPAPETHVLDALADAAEDDGQRVHDEAGVYPCPEHCHTVLLRLGVDLLGELGVAFPGVR